MNLEGLLTYFALLAAALAIMDPVQRRALGLFIPKWLLPGSIALALTLLIFRDMPLGLRPPFGWPLDLVRYCLTLGAFVIPSLCAVLAWSLWYSARLTLSNMPKLEAFFHTALQQGQFDEVERILLRNHDRIRRMPTGAATTLFQPRMVRYFIESHSFMHLELLVNRAFLDSLKNRFQAVEVVTREMLTAEASPIQSAVVATYGGIEHLVYTSQEKELIESTFLNPDWYHAANAHYPLIITAVNKIQSGELDAAYNRPDENYLARQGVSRRSRCPVYLAIKTEVMAIERAIELGNEKDFYISDLFQILQKVFEHSTFDVVATQTCGPRADHTPYSYLIETIASDLESLTEEAVRQSVKTSLASGEEPKPTQNGIILLRMWSFSICLLMGKPGHIDPALRDQIVDRYFRFLFALGFEPSEIVFAGANRPDNLNHWRRPLLKELRDGLRNPGQEIFTTLHSVFRSLDMGKPFIGDGYEWLRTQLPESFFPLQSSSR